MNSTVVAQTTLEQSAARIFQSPDDFLRLELEAQQVLFGVQTASTQRFLEAEARHLSEAITQDAVQVRFRLPRQVVVESMPPYGLRLGSPRATMQVPQNASEHIVGGLLERASHAHVAWLVRQRLTDLELSWNRATSVAAALLRHATALYMVRTMLPSGRTVRYLSLPDEDIDTIPIQEASELGSALTAPTDAIVQEEDPDEDRGETVVPYTPAARRFFLPQWVVVDDQGNLLVNSMAEAEAHLASMQRFLEVLHTAFAFAPYISVDEAYRQKRYGMIGQLVNQGRALARYETQQIIRSLQQRAAARNLNRGLRISLPYFNDQTFSLDIVELQVTPTARILFAPQYVVRACREQQAKVAQDTRLSPSTCKHLLSQLRMIEQAFNES